MKIGWGTRITLLYCSFVVMVLTMVFLAMSQDFHLVTENYYEEEILYQDKINKIKNSEALPEQLDIDYDLGNRQVNLLFPQDLQPKGKVLFYRPSDSGQDKEVAIETDAANAQDISIESLSKGLWKIQVEWEAGSTGYFDEKTIVIQ